MEIWKDAVGFEGYYEVSNQGNVRRIGRNKLLAKTRDKDGYIVHCFSVNNKRYNVMAHKLVIEAFTGPCPIGQVTRHRDGSRNNNNITNLHYGTPAENSADMVQQGTQTKGSASHLAKLTEQDVLAIRTSSLSQIELAEFYGVSQGNISQILSRTTWRHI